MLELEGVLASARSFAQDLAEIDRNHRRLGRTLPNGKERVAVEAQFWSLMAQVDSLEEQDVATPEARRLFREALDGWLWRSALWNHGRFQPHGYPGDYRIIEAMYDLEGAAFRDPTQPSIVNILDYLFWTVDSVQAVCERRHWFAQLLSTEHARRAGEIRILDIASGGARYISDYLTKNDCSNVSVTIVDQDASAIEFCRLRSLAPWWSNINPVCIPIRHMREKLAGEFDVIIASGLCDYLNGRSVTALLQFLDSLLVQGGIMAFSNFSPEDRSASTKTWIVEWILNYRNEKDCKDVMPDHLDVDVRRSSNRSLILVSGRK